MGLEQSLRRQVHDYARVAGVLAAGGRLSGQASQRGQQRGPVTWKEAGQVSPGTGTGCQCWSPAAARRTSDGRRWAGAWSRSRRTAGRIVPIRMLQVRAPPGFKLDPVLRPKDWTKVAVTVPRRLGSAYHDQRESGRLFYVEGSDRGVPAGRLIVLDSGGQAGPWSRSRQTTGPRAVAASEGAGPGLFAARRR